MPPMAPPPKFNYDSEDFTDELLALAMQGYTDDEIADALEERFGQSLDPTTFSSMKNGHYECWSARRCWTRRPATPTTISPTP